MTNMQELIKGKLAPGRGRETDNGVTGLCASSGRILNSRIQSGNRLQAQARPRPTARLTTGPCRLLSGSPAHSGAGHGGHCGLEKAPGAPGHNPRCLENHSWYLRL